MVVRRRNTLSGNKEVLVPADLELDRDDPLHDATAVFASWMMERTASTDEYRDGALIPVGCKALRNLLSGKYSKVVAAAERMELIERHHSYLALAFPKSMRLTDRYRDGRTRRVVLKRARHADAGALSIPADPVCQWLWNNLSRFTLPDSFVPTDNWTAYAAESIRRKDWSFFRDEFGRRIHTNFSRASLTIRGAILMQHNGIVSFDTDLFELDVRNCQPLLLGFLASKWWIQRRFSVPPDLQRWLDACQFGQLYEDLADRANRETNSNDYDREWVKSNIMTAHYAEQRIVDSCYLAQIERRLYPAIYEFLCWLRTQPIKGEPQALWFRSTSMQAQRIESKLMIDTACKTLMDSNPMACVLTIHDAMIVEGRNLEAAKNAILSAFERVGLKPKIKEQPLCDIKPKPQLSPEERTRRSERSKRKRLHYARARMNARARMKL